MQAFGPSSSPVLLQVVGRAGGPLEQAWASSQPSGHDVPFRVAFISGSIVFHAETVVHNACRPGKGTSCNIVEVCETFSMHKYNCFTLF